MPELRRDEVFRLLDEAHELKFELLLPAADEEVRTAADEPLELLVDRARDEVAAAWEAGAPECEPHREWAVAALGFDAGQEAVAELGRERHENEIVNAAAARHGEGYVEVRPEGDGLDALRERGPLLLAFVHSGLAQATWFAMLRAATRPVFLPMPVAGRGLSAGPIVLAHGERAGARWLPTPSQDLVLQVLAEVLAEDGFSAFALDGYGAGSATFFGRHAAVEIQPVIAARAAGARVVVVTGRRDGTDCSMHCSAPLEPERFAGVSEMHQALLDTAERQLGGQLGQLAVVPFPTRDYWPGRRVRYRRRDAAKRVAAARAAVRAADADVEAATGGAELRAARRRREAALGTLRAERERLAALPAAEAGAEPEGPVAAAVARIERATGTVRDWITTEFERLQREGSSAEAARELGVANRLGQFAEDGSPCPSSPAKYAFNTRAYIPRLLPLLPHFEGVRSAFDIGVGPGVLFVLLQDGLGLRMTGCDVRLDEQKVYRRLRDELGITSRVVEHAVTAYQEVPITPGAEAVLAFGSVFNAEWGVAEHEWFIDQCRQKLSGPKRMFWRFNLRGFVDNRDVRRFYEERATFPVQTDPAFCYLDA